MDKKSLSAKIKECEFENLGGQNNGYKMAFHLLNKGFTKNIIILSMLALKRQMEKQKTKDPYPYLDAIARRKTQNINANLSIEEHRKIVAQEKAFIKSGGLEKLGIKIS